MIALIIIIGYLVVGSVLFRLGMKFADFDGDDPIITMAFVICWPLAVAFGVLMILGIIIGSSRE